MWLMLIFLLRPYLVLIFSLSNRSDRMQLVNLIYSDKIMMDIGAIAGIPVAFLIYAWGKKDPDASDFVKKIWHNGKQLIAISAVLNAFIFLIPIFTKGIEHINLYGWAQFAISIVILIMAYQYTYLSDCFADYPVHDPEEK